MMHSVRCIIMAGGQGNRFGSPTKFLQRVCGEIIIVRLLKQLRAICSHVLLVLSKHTLSELKSLCSNYEIDCIELCGENYVKDLAIILDAYIKLPALVLAADIVARESKVIAKFVEEALSEPAEVVTAVTSRNGGAEPIGLSLFKAPTGSWRNIVLPPNLITDIDEVKDLKQAEKVCSNNA